MSIKTTINKLWTKQVVRFACIGVVNTLTDIAILNGLVFLLGMGTLTANIISASVSIVLSYFWNHIVVFQKEHPLSLQLFVKFVLVTGISVIGVQELIIFGFEHVLTLSRITTLTGLDGNHAQALQTNGAKVLAVGVGMVWNFVLYKLVVFKKPKPDTKDIDDEGVVPY